MKYIFNALHMWFLLHLFDKIIVVYYICDIFFTTILIAIWLLDELFLVH